MIQAAPTWVYLISPASALAGVVVGLLAERLLRRLGRVECEPYRVGLRLTNPSKSYDGSSGWYMEGLGTIPDYLATHENTTAVFVFNADFFNSREVPTGLRALKLVLHYSDREPSRIEGIRANVVGAGGSNQTWGSLDALNLPPRHIAGIDAEVLVPDPSLLVHCRRAELEAVFPERRYLRYWLKPKRFACVLAKHDPAAELRYAN